MLSVFHDVFYYDDFAHHDERVLDIFGPYLRSRLAPSAALH